MSTNIDKFPSDYGTTGNQFSMFRFRQKYQRQLKLRPASPTNGYRFIQSALLDTKMMLKMEKLVDNFYGQIKDVPLFEKTLYEFRGVDRPPGIVIDLVIVISSSNRESEYLLYDKLSTLMREHPEMLFDFRIIRRRGRSFGQIVPPEFTECRVSHMVV